MGVDIRRGSTARASLGSAMIETEKLREGSLSGGRPQARESLLA